MRETASILPLIVDRLGYATGGRTILSNISFEALRGRRLFVLGPNGSGKTMLLKLCHGLLDPTSGSIQFAADLPVGRIKRHAMVFQKPVMLRRSALANLTHALAASGLGFLARRARAREALDRFGLGSLADRPARLLSGGEQQRLAIARVWALSPELVFLDEPTSALDPGAVREIEVMLAQLHAEGVTLVMTTHDLGQARRLADDVILLDRGRIVEAGPAQTFFSSPVTQTARAFLVGDLPW